MLAKCQSMFINKQNVVCLCYILLCLANHFQLISFNEHCSTLQLKYKGLDNKGESPFRITVTKDAGIPNENKEGFTLASSKDGFS